MSDTGDPKARASSDVAAEAVVAATREWIEKAVVGLDLCPFAGHAYRGERIRYRVSAQRSASELVGELAEELQLLHVAEPQACETSLLIHPHVLADFGDYNQFLDEADAMLVALGFDGELQIASFHPAYQFAGAAPDDIENYSNRSPYPMLHLLREASVTRAVETFAGVHEIGDKNTATLRRLGHDGWNGLWGAADDRRKP